MGTATVLQKIPPNENRTSLASPPKSCWDKFEVLKTGRILIILGPVTKRTYFQFYMPLV